MKKSFGFTLAEVLVSLGVIGVISVMTLPTLTGRFQKALLMNQFRQKYAMILEAFKQAEVNMRAKPECYYWKTNPYTQECIEYKEDGVTCAKRDGAYCTGYYPEGHPSAGNCMGYKMKKDDGPLPGNYNGNMNECTRMKNEVKKVLQVLTVCSNKSYEKGCIPEYAGIDTLKRISNPDMSDYDIAMATSGCGGWRKDSILNSRESWVLADGTIILFYSGFQLFAVDINGKKGPNRWGYDIFNFETISMEDRPLELIGGGCIGVEKGGTSTATMIQNVYKNERHN